MRTHGYRRHKTFQPLCGTLPVNGDDLGKRSVTIAFLDMHSEASVYEDSWTTRGAVGLPLR